MGVEQMKLLLLIRALSFQSRWFGVQVYDQACNRFDQLSKKNTLSQCTGKPVTAFGKLLTKNKTTNENFKKGDLHERGKP
jgi:hypothetical protein